MDLGLAGKVVLVTGASKGIGYACAVAFAAEGARVDSHARLLAFLRSRLAPEEKAAAAPAALPTARPAAAGDVRVQILDQKREAVVGTVPADRQVVQIGADNDPERDEVDAVPVP